MDKRDNHCEWVVDFGKGEGVVVVDSCRTRLDRVPSLLKRFRQSVLAAATAGRAVLLGHVGALATGDAKTLVKTCRANGYAAVSAIPPVYFPASKASIHRYYSDIAEAAPGAPVTLPVTDEIPAGDTRTLTVASGASASFASSR